MADPCWIALLRGINVGTAKRMAMADLRRILGAVGGGEARTLLNSGNAVFTAPGSEMAVAGQVEAAIRDELGLEVRVLLRSRNELASVIADNPLLAEGLDPGKLAVSFLDAEPVTGRWDLEPEAYLPDRWARGKRAVYLYLPNGFSGSQLPDFGKVLGVTPTARNWNTVTKLAALAAA
ncbi:MAG TPA: DUF1697 domain-containing protein [Acidimicrobiales bacterium]|jgi:uncharacterized protein (DUF1697 family)